MDWKYSRASDEELSLAKKFSSYQRETGLVTTICSLTALIVLKIYFRIFHRISVSGKVNIPKNFPFILISNHSSHLDSLVLMSVLPFSYAGHVFPIAAGDTFFVKFLPSFFASQFMNALPLWRKKNVAHNLAKLKEKLLSTDSALILFPEGTRARDGQIKKFKQGIGMLCAGEDIRVVPVGLTGTWDSLKPGNKMLRFKKIKAQIGESISFKDCKNDRQGWQKIANTLQKEVSELLHQDLWSI